MEPENDSSSPRRDQGLYLILVAFFLFVLVALCALVVGLGLMATSKARMQNIANVSSIAALQHFTQNLDNTGNPLPYATRKAAALQRANEIIGENEKLPGVNLPLGELALNAQGEGGQLVFGMWYPEPPAVGTPCGTSADDYPCFVANPDNPPGTPAANAVKLIIKTQPDNSFVAPFAKVLGKDRFTLQTDSIARVVQRCVAFLLDISISTIAETHIATDYRTDDLTCFPPCDPAAQATLYPTPVLVAVDPTPVSLFAYRVDELGPMASLTPPPAPTPHPCQNPSNYNSSEEFFYYCNMQPSRNGVEASGGAGTREHFRSDYRRMASPWGTVAVDSYYQSMSGYFGPQPLSRFFLSFNAGLRAVKILRSTGDKAMVYAFTGTRVGSEPEPTPPQAASLTENLDPLIQLTNIMNRGMINASGTPIASAPVVTPNFISRGWFPLLTNNMTDPVPSTTNHAKALWDAIEALSRCPDSARRTIVIATDGIPTCGFNRSNPGGTPTANPAVDCPPPVGTGIDYYYNYLEAEAAILGPIKNELIKRGISVTALLDSDSIDPHFINATIAPGLTPTPAGGFVNPDEAAKYGFCGVPGPGCQPFFNLTPSTGSGNVANWAATPTNCDDTSATPAAHCSDEHFAFQHLSAPQIQAKFRRPNGLWGQLAMDTGGVICPLLDPCPANYYAVATPPALLPTARAGMSVVNCAPINQDKTQQAINCVLAAVGVDPFQNVEPIPTP